MKNRAVFMALMILCAMIIAALIGPLVLPYSSTQQGFESLSSPSITHPMGTDDLGRDVLSRVLAGSRLSLFVGITSVLVAFGLGILIGSISGYFGGFVDVFIMRVVDIFLAFPFVLGALALMIILGSSAVNIVIAISAFMWASFARMQRAQVMQLREVEYVQAAKLYGASNFRIIFKHLLPNTTGPLIVYAATAVGAAILGEACLSFIQVGLQPPYPSLGLLLEDALQYIEVAPWLMFFPGLVLLMVVGCFVVIGDGLRDFLDEGHYEQS